MPSRMARSTSSRVTAARAGEAEVRTTSRPAIARANRARSLEEAKHADDLSRRESGSGQGGVDDDVGGDLEGRLVSIALAVEPGMPFQGAADVVLGVDDGPVAVDLDALELGEVLAAAGGLGVLGVGEVEADLGGVELVVAGDRRPGGCREAARRRTGGRRRRRRGCRRRRRRRGCRRRARCAAARPRGPPSRRRTRPGREGRSAGSRSGWGRGGRAPCG